MSETKSEEAYFNELPRKSSGAAVYLFDAEGRLLIVKPTYKAGWGLPGGSVEDGESPRAAALREVHEELGIALSSLRFIAVDYLPADPPRTEQYQFMFDGGVLDAESIASIRLPGEELSEYRFVPIEEAELLLNPRQGGRLRPCLAAKDHGRAQYLENGTEPV